MTLFTNRVSFYLVLYVTRPLNEHLRCPFIVNQVVTSRQQWILEYTGLPNGQGPIVFNTCSQYPTQSAGDLNVVHFYSMPAGDDKCTRYIGIDHNPWTYETGLNMKVLINGNLV